MSHSRMASIRLLHLLASPAVAFFLFRPEALFPPPGPTDAAAIRQIHPLESLPTPAPLWRPRDVVKNDDSTTLLLDSKTCGFEDGLVDNAFQCVAETRSCTNDGTYIGCCDVGSTCVDAFPMTCIDFDGFEAGRCDTKGTRTLCCTDEQRGKCKTLTMLDTLVGIACGSEAGSGTILLSPTDYDGPISTVTADTTTTDILSGGFGGSGETETETGVSQSTAIDVDPTDDGEGPRPSTGAIIGGVVGAVAVFTLVILGAVWFVKRKKDDQEDDNLSPNAPPPLPYCIPETAQTPPGSGSDYAYPYTAGPYARSSVPSSSRSEASTIEHGRPSPSSNPSPDVNTRP